MEPATIGALISAAATVGGPLLVNDMNRRSVNKQMNFQERMANTSAQRAVADYKAAGLNPALAYDRPAPSPIGTAMEAQDPIAPAAREGISTALRAKEFALARTQTEAQVKKTAADINKTAADTTLSNAQAQVALTNAKLANQQYLFNMFSNPLELSEREQNIYNKNQERRNAIQQWEVMQRNMNLTDAQIAKLQQDMLFSRTNQPWELAHSKARALEAFANARLAGTKIPGAQAEADWAKTIGRLAPALNTAKSITQMLQELGIAGFGLKRLMR